MSNTGLTSYFGYTVKVIKTIGEKLYLSEVMADFHFVFELADGRCERIPAHKNFLSSASDVFRAMLNGCWMEKEVTKIVDASPSAFKEFLQFFYLSQVKVTIENVAQVMNMGKKYNIPECVEVCKKFLISTLSSETVCLAYGLALLLEEKDLLKMCKRKIKFSKNEIFASASFLNCDLKVLEHVMQLKHRSCTGGELIKAFMSWLKSASKQEHLTREHIEEHFGDLFFEIPFGSMSFKDFAKFDRLHDGLLTDDERKEIIQMIASESYQPKIFSTNRKLLFGISMNWNEDAVIMCDRRVMDIHPYFIGKTETTCFTSNKAILLGGIVFGGLSVHRSDKYRMVMDVIPTKITIIKINLSIPSDEGVIIYRGQAYLDGLIGARTLLSDPILIKPEFMYKIQMEQQPPAACCTTYQLKSEVEVEFGITIKFHSSTWYGDEMTGGLIEQLKINSIET